MDESAQSQQCVSSSAWSTLSNDTVPLLDDIERVEAEERVAPLVRGQCAPPQMVAYREGRTTT